MELFYHFQPHLDRELCKQILKTDQTLYYDVVSDMSVLLA